MPDGVDDYLSAATTMRELGVTRQRLAQLRQGGAFGDGCRYDKLARCWTYRAGAVEMVRLWRGEVYDRLTNPWPPWTKRDATTLMPDQQPESDDGEKV